MQHRDGRQYSYDDSLYTMAQHSDYSPQATYQAFDSPGQYYAPPVNPASDSYRSMTPSVVPSTRFPRDGRLYTTPPVHASSSTAGQPAYTPGGYYGAQYMDPAEQRSASMNPSPPFIPTPSEIAHTYNYGPSVGTIPHDEYSSGADYPAPHPSTLVPSATRSRGIVAGRPRTGSSPSVSPTAQSASGERFPCEKCGKTFSRSHDRKRHHETQHLASPIIHRCRYCEKEFSRADSLKRHVDNGCDEMHSQTHS